FLVRRRRRAGGLARAGRRWRRRVAADARKEALRAGALLLLDLLGLDGPGPVGEHVHLVLETHGALEIAAAGARRGLTREGLLAGRKGFQLGDDPLALARVDHRRRFPAGEAGTSDDGRGSRSQRCDILCVGADLQDRALLGRIDRRPDDDLAKDATPDAVTMGSRSMGVRRDERQRSRLGAREAFGWLRIDAKRIGIEPSDELQETRPARSRQLSKWMVTEYEPDGVVEGFACA